MSVDQGASVSQQMAELYALPAHQAMSLLRCSVARYLSGLPGGHGVTVLSPAAPAPVSVSAIAYHLMANAGKAQVKKPRSVKLAKPAVSIVVGVIGVSGARYPRTAATDREPVHQSVLRVRV